MKISKVLIISMLAHIISVFAGLDDKTAKPRKYRSFPNLESLTPKQALHRFFKKNRLLFFTRAVLFPAHRVLRIACGRGKVCIAHADPDISGLNSFFMACASDILATEKSENVVIM